MLHFSHGRICICYGMVWVGSGWFGIIHIVALGLWLGKISPMHGCITLARLPRVQEAGVHCSSPCALNAFKGNGERATLKGTHHTVATWHVIVCDDALERVSDILGYAANFSRKKMDPIDFSEKTPDQIHSCFFCRSAPKIIKQSCIWSCVFTDKPIGLIFLREKIAACRRMSLTRSSASSHTSQAKLTLYNQSERS